jgi:hypothetical protein
MCVITLLLSHQHMSTQVLLTLLQFTSFHSFDHLSPHRSFSISVTHSTEPKTYREVCQSKHWLKAINAELEALAKNGTWIIVDLPSNVKPIGSKWAYIIKHKADVSIDRYMARLIAKGHNQIKGQDFFDIFSLVAKLTTIRILLTIASIQNWHFTSIRCKQRILFMVICKRVYT